MRLSWRLPAIVHSVLIAILFLGGSYLIKRTLDNARVNSEFICAFGHALNAAPITQRAEESDAQFRKRVALTRKFVNDLNRIQECEPPAAIRVHPRDREALRRANKRSGREPPSKGGTGRTRPPSASGDVSGGGTQQAPPVSQPPRPPSGGPPPSPPKPPKPPKPPRDGLLDPVTDDLPTDCRITVAGVRICNS